MEAGGSLHHKRPCPLSLRDARHIADYDPIESFSRLQTTKHIEDAEQATQALERIQRTPRIERLLWEMLLGKLEQ